MLNQGVYDQRPDDSHGHQELSQRSPMTPGWLSPNDDRRLRDVFTKPGITFANPDQVHWKRNNNGGIMEPVSPGAPVTTGLMQVCYDDQPMYDRSKIDQCGPVRAFFRAMIAAKQTIVQA